MKLVDRTVEGVDRIQQRRTWLGFPLAVVKKFGEDNGGNLAALIAFYAFFSLFPLLIVFVAILGFVLQGNTHLQKTILDSALTQFPVIGDQLKRNIGSVQGSGIALVIGLLLTLWAGLGGVKAVSSALDTVWDVPFKHRLNFLKSTLRALIMLAILGTGTLAATGLSAIATGGGDFSPLKILGIIGATLLNFGVFLIAFRILTAAEVTWSEVLPGAVVAAIGWEALQLAGAYIVGHQIKNAKETYGTFAFVIGLLVWLRIGAQVTLYAAEINVVKARRLWPRALREPPGTRADEIALRRYAHVEERVPGESVEVKFDKEKPEDRPADRRS
jgi:membrane protein